MDLASRCWNCWKTSTSDITNIYKIFDARRLKKQIYIYILYLFYNSRQQFKFTTFYNYREDAFDIELCQSHSIVLSKFDTDGILKPEQDLQILEKNQGEL